MAEVELTGARGLHASLVKRGVKKVEYREYDDVEHLIVVQLGLRDVFAFFEAASGSKWAKEPGKP